MKFTVEFKQNEFRNLEKVEYVINDDVTLPKLTNEVIRPMLFAIGYAEESIEEVLGEYYEC